MIVQITDISGNLMNMKNYFVADISRKCLLCIALYS